MARTPSRRTSRVLALLMLVPLAGCLVVDPAGRLAPTPLGNNVAVPAASSSRLPGDVRSAARTIKLRVGEDLLLADFLRDASGELPVGRVQWLSTNPRVASVQGVTGLARGLTPGTTVIIASLPRLPDGQVQIEVRVDATQTVNQVVLTPVAPTVAIGGQVPLMAEVHMADGTINANVAWSSSDDTVATVNPTTGVVTGIKPGRVTIVGAYALDPAAKGEADVRVVADNKTAPSPLPSGAPPLGATPIPGPTPPHVTVGGAPVPGSLDQEQSASHVTIEASNASKLAQTFTPSRSGNIVAVLLQLDFPGSPAPDATLSIFATGTDGKPTGQPLGSSQISGTSIPKNRQEGWTGAILVPPVPVIAGTRYAWVLGVSSLQGLRVGADDDTRYVPGEAFVASGITSTVWSRQLRDMAFRIYLGPEPAVASQIEAAQ